jgi:hypothetical protein
MSLSQCQITSRKPHTRSAITNGKLLPGADQRSSHARRFRDVTEALGHAIQNGEALSVAEQALIRQAALVIVQTEAMQLAAARGEAIDPDGLVRLTNLANRLLAPFLKRGRGQKKVLGVEALLKSIEGRGG